MPDPIAPRPKIVGALAAFLLGCLAFAAAIDLLAAEYGGQEA